jgi:hypothetical protein
MGLSAQFYARRANLCINVASRFTYDTAALLDESYNKRRCTEVVFANEAKGHAEARPRRDLLLL